MPNFDKTGPLGTGPMGRGRGGCNETSTPACSNGPGFGGRRGGMGQGMSQGMGRGGRGFCRRRSGQPATMTREDEAAQLENQIESGTRHLDALKERLAELRNNKE